MLTQVFRDAACSFDDVRMRKRIETGHADAQRLRDFLKCLAVAHTVVPEEEAPATNATPAKPATPAQYTGTNVVYCAESPDEGALVTAAKVRQHTSAYVSISQHTSAYVSTESPDAGALETAEKVLSICLLY
jgi:magnesium-transporting ATPase (P-type)